MKTENLKVGDWLICTSHLWKNYTKNERYFILNIENKNHYIEDDFGVEVVWQPDGLVANFKVEQTEKPKGKHIGYIYPFETYKNDKVYNKIILLESHSDMSGSYQLRMNYEEEYYIAQEVAETFEKYYEPVEEPITIGGMDVDILPNNIYIDKDYWSVSEIKAILDMIKTEPNLAEKLQLIINKMEK